MFPYPCVHKFIPAASSNNFADSGILDYIRYAISPLNTISNLFNLYLSSILSTI